MCACMLTYEDKDPSRERDAAACTGQCFVQRQVLPILVHDTLAMQEQEWIDLHEYLP